MTQRARPDRRAADHPCRPRARRAPGRPRDGGRRRPGARPHAEGREQSLGETHDRDGVEIEADGRADRSAEDAGTEASDATRRRGELRVHRARANAPGAGSSSSASRSARRSSAASTASNDSCSSTGQRRMLAGSPSASTSAARLSSTRRRHPPAVVSSARRLRIAATKAASSTAVCATLPGRAGASGVTDSPLPRTRSRSRSAISTAYRSSRSAQSAPSTTPACPRHEIPAVHRDRAAVLAPDGSTRQVRDDVVARERRVDHADEPARVRPAMVSASRRIGGPLWARPAAVSAASTVRGYGSTAGIRMAVRSMRTPSRRARASGE